MKSRALLYAGCLAALLFLSLGGILLSQHLGAGAALSKLGGGARELEEARQQLLLTSSDPAEKIFKFILNPSNSERARIQALEILGDLAKQQKTDQGAEQLLPLLEPDGERSRPLVLGVLSALEDFANPKTIPAIAKLSRETRDSALMQQCFRTLKVTQERLGRKISNALNERDTVTASLLLPDFEAGPGQKGVLFPRIAQYHQSMGDAGRASTFYRRLGLVKKWWVLGPFDNHRMSGFDRDLGPDSKPFDSTSRFAINSTDSASWFRLTFMPYDGALDLRTLFVKPTYNIGYLHTYVHSPDERDALIGLGGGDWLRVWLNGKPVWTTKVYRVVTPDDDLFRVRLKPGPNSLLIKVAQDLGTWGLICRIADLHGEAFPDLGFSFDGVRSGAQTTEIVEAYERQETERAGKLLSDRIGDNQGADAALISIAVDKAEPPQKRAAAFSVLSDLNRALQSQDGKRDILRFVRAELASAAPDPLLSRAMESLAEMEITEGLELGLEAREKGLENLVYAGNRLVSLHCRQEILRMGNLDGVQERPDMRRKLKKILDMEPTDTWSMAQLMGFAGRTQDTAVMARLSPYLSIPHTWWYQAGLTADSAALGSLARSLVWPRIEEGEKQSRPDESKWRQMVRNTGKDFGLYLIFEGSLQVPKDSNYSAIATTVHSSRAGRAWLRVTLPFRHQAYLNRVKVGSRFLVLDQDFNWPENYRGDRRKFDVDEYPVELKAGRNDLLFLFFNRQPEKIHMNRLHCTFADAQGRNLQFQGNNLIW